MSIEIRSEQCIGCGRCRGVCPGSLIHLQRGKAEILRPERCWGCASCLKECPVQAIALYLGEDMGGLGGRFSIQRTGTQLHWTLTKPDGSTKTLTVDSRSANKY